MELKLGRDTLTVTRLKLLIVPYGIETKNGTEKNTKKHSFNRTLWN